MRKESAGLRAFGIAGCIVLGSFGYARGQAPCLIRDDSYAAGLRPQALATADFDRDGKADVVATNWNANDIVLFRGLGNGKFAPGTAIPVAFSPNSVVAADLNGDGAPDVAIAHYGIIGSNTVHTISVLLNAGDGTFPSPHSYTVTDAFWICAGDFDRDGDIDLAVADHQSPGHVTTLYNDGTGAFTVGGSFLTGGADPSSIIAANLDCDGDLDLAVTNETDGSMTVLFNDGLGDFSSTLTLIAGNGAYSVCAADLNRDGRMDLITADWQEDSVSVFMSTGCGAFSAPGKSSTHGANPHSVNAADLDRDGYVDVFTPNWGSGTLSVLTNDRTGHLIFADSMSSGTNPAYAIAVDLDGNYAPEVVVANEYSDNLSVFLNHCACPPLPVICPIEATDTNCDGVIDVFDVIEAIAVAFSGKPPHDRCCKFQ